MKRLTAALTLVLSACAGGEAPEPNPYASAGVTTDPTGAPDLGGDGEDPLPDVPAGGCFDNHPGQQTGSDWGPCCSGHCGGANSCAMTATGSICTPDECDSIATLKQSDATPYSFAPLEGCRVPCDPECPHGMECDAQLGGCVWAP